MTGRVARVLAVSIVSTLSAMIALGFLAGCGSAGGGGAAGGGLVMSGTLVTQPNSDTGSALGPAAAWSVNVPSYVQPTKDWTVLVYMNGANNLGLGNGNFDQLNASQMEQVGSNSNLNIVVEWQAENNDGEFTGSFGGGPSESTPAWTGTRRYYITQHSNDSSENIASVLMSQNSTVDEGDPQTLQDFVQWGIATFPAQHYCLILWDHGASWRAVTLRGVKSTAVSSRSTTSTPGKPAVSKRGFSFDYLTGAAIDTNQIGAAINISSTAAKKWDLVVWDCSLMQTLEVLYDMTSPAASTLNGQSYVAPTYIVGTEESPPGAGLPYNLFLGDLASNPTETPLALGTDICMRDINYYNVQKETGTTYSVVATSGIPAVAQAVNTLGSALTSASPTYANDIAGAQANAEVYGQEDGPTYEGAQDLVNFTQFLNSPSSPYYAANATALLSACSGVQTAVQNAVVFNDHGAGHPDSNGIAIWNPTPTEYANVEWEQENNEGITTMPYTSLSFAQAAPSWVNFISGGNPNAATPP